MASSGQTLRQQIGDALVNLDAELDQRSMESLKLSLFTRLDTNHMQSEMLKTKSLTQICDVLLSSYDKIHLSDIVIILAEEVPKLIHDIPHVTQKLKQLGAFFNQRLEVIGMTREAGTTNPMYGRETEKQLLIESLTSTANEMRHINIVNVCGMAGIGKSHIVKHVATQLLIDEWHVVYVDAKGLKSAGDVACSLLSQLDQSGSDGSSQESLLTLMSGLCEDGELLKRLTGISNRSLLILDDLSLPLSNAAEASTMLNFLATVSNILYKPNHGNDIQRKIVITSQHKLESDSDYYNTDVLAKSKKILGDSIKDIVLSRLSDAEARKFLNSELMRLDEGMRAMLLKHCDGHPYTLEIVRRTAESVDARLSIELTQPTSSDISKYSKTVAERLFDRSFQTLTPTKRDILLILSLFESGISIKNLHNIMKTHDSVSEFYDYLRENFRSGFWLSLVSFENESFDKTIVKPYHSLVSTYLNTAREKIVIEDIAKLECRIVSSFVHIWKKIGKLATKSTDKMRDLFYRNKDNFKVVIPLISKQQKGQILVSETTSQLDVQGFLHLCVCWHYYWDSFDNRLVQLLNEINASTLNTQTQVLLSTLHMLVLIVSREWDRIESMASDEACFVKHAAGLPKELRCFCKAVHSFGLGMVLTHEPKFIDKKDADFVSRRTELYKEAVRELEKMDIKEVAQYFMVFIRVNMAQGIWLANREDKAAIAEAAKICLSSLKLTKSIPVIEPLVTANIALYTQLEAQYVYADDLDKKKKLYEKTVGYHEKVANTYKKLGMQFRYKAAENNVDHGTALRSLGRVWSSMGDEAKAIQVLERSKHVYSCQIRVMETSIDELPAYHALYFKNLLYLGNCFSDMHASALQLKRTDFMYQCEADALHTYYKAYKFLKTHFATCHVSAEDRCFEDLLDLLPLLLRRDQRETEAEQVDSGLRHLQKRCKKLAEGTSSSESSSSGNSSPERMEDNEPLTLTTAPQYRAIFVGPVSSSDITSTSGDIMDELRELGVVAPAESTDDQAATSGILSEDMIQLQISGTGEDTIDSSLRPAAPKKRKAEGL